MTNHMTTSFHSDSVGGRRINDERETDSTVECL